ncbi:uncharacterized protein BDV17DRAFT_285934 [Aspergillus undulatus]|uniref:uncharacterized protein n=1 Tax=Aspergillus undulatus TaxID=1810928 RepID=UPI003CCD0B78
MNQEASLAQDGTQSPLPTYSRRFGRTYHGLDRAASTGASLLCQDIGKVQVDCRLCVRQSQWGQLGTPGTPAAIVYMDLCFHQPQDCRLANATVLITLEEPVIARSSKKKKERDDRDRRKDGGTSSLLHMTDYYGPKHLIGDATNVTVTKALRLAPQLNVFGGGVGGISLDHEQAVSYNARWSFTGQLLPGQPKTTGAGAGASTAYKTLKWELCENEFGGRSNHTNVIHTGFALQHTPQPFVIRIEIHGKLQSKRDRIRNVMRTMRFPRSSDRDQGISETLVCPDATPSRMAKALDRIALGLSSDMERRNLMRVPVHIPDSLPVSFTADTEANLMDAPPLPPQPLSPAQVEAVASASNNPITDQPQSMRLKASKNNGSMLLAPEDVDSISTTGSKSAMPGFSSSSTLVDAPQRLGHAGVEPLEPYMAALEGAVDVFQGAQRQRMETKAPAIPPASIEELAQAPRKLPRDDFGSQRTASDPVVATIKDRERTLESILKTPRTRETEPKIKAEIKPDTRPERRRLSPIHSNSVRIHRSRPSSRPSVTLAVTDSDNSNNDSHNHKKKKKKKKKKKHRKKENEKKEQNKNKDKDSLTYHHRRPRAPGLNLLHNSSPSPSPPLLLPIARATIPAESSQMHDHILHRKRTKVRWSTVS